MPDSGIQKCIMSHLALRSCIWAVQWLWQFQGTKTSDRLQKLLKILAKMKQHKLWWPISLMSIMKESIVVNVTVEGLKVVLKVFPEGLTTGTPPAELTGVKAKVTQQADQSQFTSDDINKVEIYLDNALEDKGSTSEFVLLPSLIFCIFMLHSSYCVADDSETWNCIIESLHAWQCPANIWL